MREDHIADAIRAALGDKVNNLACLCGKRQCVNNHRAFRRENRARRDLGIQSAGEYKNVVRDTLSLHGHLVKLQAARQTGWRITHNEARCQAVKNESSRRDTDWNLTF